MKATIRYLDTCLSDYFQGSSHPTIAVPVDGMTTLIDVVKGIEDDAPGDEWSEAQWEAFEAAIAALRAVHTNPLALFNKDLESPGEDDRGESVYAYFDVVFEEDE